MTCHSSGGLTVMGAQPVLLSRVSEGSHFGVEALYDEGLATKVGREFTVYCNLAMLMARNFLKYLRNCSNVIATPFTRRPTWRSWRPSAHQRLPRWERGSSASSRLSTRRPWLVSGPQRCDQVSRLPLFRPLSKTSRHVDLFPGEVHL